MTIYDDYTGDLEREATVNDSTVLELFNVSSTSEDDYFESDREVSPFIWIKNHSWTKPGATSFVNTENSVSRLVVNTIFNFPYRSNAFFGFRPSTFVPYVQHFHIPTVPSQFQHRPHTVLLSEILPTENYSSRFKNSLRLDFDQKLNCDQFDGSFNFYYEKMENIDRNNNLRCLSEACDEHLRQLQYNNLRNTQKFLRKLCNLKYSSLTTPESEQSSDEAVRLDTDTSLLNYTISCEPYPAMLDSVDLKILEKITQHSKIYGNLPDLFHRISEEILYCRKYNDTTFQPLKSTSSTQTEEEKMRTNKAVASECIEKVDTNSLTSDHFQQDNRVPLHKNSKIRRNRNFVLENIERFKLNPSRDFSLLKNDVKKQTLSSNKKPLTKRRRLQNLTVKCRSLQFATDEEDLGKYKESAEQPIKIKEMEVLNEVLKDQTESINEISDCFNEMQNDAIEIVHLQEEINAVYSRHLESLTQDCLRVNRTVSDML
ncbi:uncharacterized protein LOC129731398 [Wyeomyia smithii]|uniref:uncharacterized protein LOC129731398 n=1 Tax=Wyeomyia smithii TaxID=174621 RepID=UPI0024681AA3|nr:uncharacterized protein LOC129731398 [Wyeomyia smithii]